MYKLLVNSPTGEQHIEIVLDTGGYFDASRVIWDERTDGQMPSLTLGKMQRVGNVLETLADYLPEHAAWLAAEQAKQSDEARKSEIDSAIGSDTTINQLKTMTNAEFNAWWDANVTTSAQAIAILKKLAKMIIRKFF